MSRRQNKGDQVNDERKGRPAEGRQGCPVRGGERTHALGADCDKREAGLRQAQEDRAQVEADLRASLEAQLAEVERGEREQLDANPIPWPPGPMAATQAAQVKREEIRAAAQAERREIRERHNRAVRELRVQEGR